MYFSSPNSAAGSKSISYSCMCVCVLRNRVHSFPSIHTGEALCPLSLSLSLSPFICVTNDPETYARSHVLRVLFSSSSFATDTGEMTDTEIREIRVHAHAKRYRKLQRFLTVIKCRQLSPIPVHTRGADAARRTAIRNPVTAQESLPFLAIEAERADGKRKEAAIVLADHCCLCQNIYHYLLRERGLRVRVRRMDAVCAVCGFTAFHDEG